MTGGLRIGRLAGIPIGVHPLWLLVVALIAWSLGDAWFPERVDGLAPASGYVLGLVSALLLFAGILLHELGHAIVARRHGVEVEEIDLWLLGGVARMRGEPQQPGDELRFALAGPAVTAALLAVFAALYAVLGGGDGWLAALVEYQLLISAMILVFNLLPAFPLDGGRVLRSLLWRFGGDRVRATMRAAAVGRVFALVLAAIGFMSLSAGGFGGLWLLLVAAFIYFAGDAEARSARLERALAGRHVADLAASPVCLAGSATALEAIERGFAIHPFTAFPVVDDGGRAIGLLSLDRVKAVPAAERELRTVAQLADADPDLLVDPATPVATLLARPAFARVGRAVVVDADRRPIGLLSTTDVARAVRVGDLLGDPLPGRGQRLLPD